MCILHLTSRTFFPLTFGNLSQKSLKNFLENQIKMYLKHNHNYFKN